MKIQLTNRKLSVRKSNDGTLYFTYLSVQTDPSKTACGTSKTCLRRFTAEMRRA